MAIPLIKFIRQIGNLGLVDAKNLVIHARDSLKTTKKPYFTFNFPDLNVPVSSIIETAAYFNLSVVAFDEEAEKKRKEEEEKNKPTPEEIDAFVREYMT